MLAAAASGEDIPARVAKWLTSLNAGTASVARALGVLMFIICGVCVMAGRSGAAWAKATIGRVVFGLALSVLAGAIVTWVLSIVS